MNRVLISGFFFAILLLLIFDAIKSVIDLSKMLYASTYNSSRLKRIKELQTSGKKNNKETIDEYTKPFINKYFPKLSNVLPSLKLQNIQQVKEDLILTG